LRDSEFITEMDGKLYYHNGIKYTIVPVGCRARNGAAEIRVQAAKRLLGTMNLTSCEVTALDLQTLVYQAANVINSTPLGSMQRNLTSYQLCPVTPLDFCMIGAERPVLKTSMMFPALLNSHFMAMQSTWNLMIKIHNEIIVPKLLLKPKWASEKNSEKIEVGDLVYMMRKGQNNFSPCYTTAEVEECHGGLDEVKRTITVRYIGPELLRRVGTKEPDDWPPQSKKRKLVIEEADVFRERTTVKDTRSVIKLTQ
jgi:hypothetical protein